MWMAAMLQSSVQKFQHYRRCCGIFDMTTWQYDYMLIVSEISNNSASLIKSISAIQQNIWNVSIMCTLGICVNRDFDHKVISAWQNKASQGLSCRYCARNKMPAASMLSASSWWATIDPVLSMNTNLCFWRASCKPSIEIWEPCYS